MRDKCVVLHSGGLDSTVLLTMLLKEGYDCYPLGISYGQRHEWELRAAYEVCQKLGIIDRYQELNIRGLHDLVHSRSSSVPFGYQSPDTLKTTVSPNRNMIFLSIAAGYAMTIDAMFIAFASHAFTKETYPDCTPEFVDSVNRTVQIATGGKVSIRAPLSYLLKAQIVRLGIELGAPLYLTWSCFKKQERPCLCCKACLERTEAFQLADTKDPSLTDEEWKDALEYLDVYSKKGVI